MSRIDEIRAKVEVQTIDNPPTYGDLRDLLEALSAATSGREGQYPILSTAITPGCRDFTPGVKEPRPFPPVTSEPKGDRPLSEQLAELRAIPWEDEPVEIDITAAPVTSEERVEAVARIISPEWFGEIDGIHVLDNYPGQHKKYQNAARTKAREIAALVATGQGEDLRAEDLVGLIKEGDARERDLRAENERLRAALGMIDDACSDSSHPHAVTAVQIARAALERM